MKPEQRCYKPDGLTFPVQKLKILGLIPHSFQKTAVFFMVFGGFLERRIPGKNGQATLCDAHILFPDPVPFNSTESEASDVGTDFSIANSPAEEMSGAASLGQGHPAAGATLVRPSPCSRHLGVGAPPILVYFSGDWDHWGVTGVLTMGMTQRKPTMRGPASFQLNIPYSDAYVLGNGYIQPNISASTVTSHDTYANQSISLAKNGRRTLV